MQAVMNALLVAATAGDGSSGGRPPGAPSRGGGGARAGALGESQRAAWSAGHIRETICCSTLRATLSPTGYADKEAISLGRSVLTLTIALVVLSTAPAAWADGHWAVRNDSNTKVGSVATVYDSSINFTDLYVYGKSGSRIGNVAPEDAYWLVWVGENPIGMLRHTKSGTWEVSGVSGGLPSSYPGRAKRASGQWLLQKRIKGTWRTRGLVSSNCPGKLAAGAVRLLLWK